MKKLYFLLGGISAIALMIVGLTTANAFGGEKPDDAGNGRPQLTQEEREQMREKMQAQHEAVQAALESGDYNTWKSLMEEKANETGKSLPVLEKINEDNFAKFVEMHQLIKDGDKDGAKAIAEELNIPGQGMMGGKFKRGMGHREMKDMNGDGVCNRADIQEEGAEA